MSTLPSDITKSLANFLDIFDSSQLVQVNKEHYGLSLKLQQRYQKIVNMAAEEEHRNINNYFNHLPEPIFIDRLYEDPQDDNLDKIKDSNDILEAYKMVARRHANGKFNLFTVQYKRRVVFADDYDEDDFDDPETVFGATDPDEDDFLFDDQDYVKTPFPKLQLIVRMCLEYSIHLIVSNRIYDNDESSAIGFLGGRDYHYHLFFDEDFIINYPGTYIGSPGYIQWDYDIPGNLWRYDISRPQRAFPLFASLGAALQRILLSQSPDEIRYIYSLIDPSWMWSNPVLGRFNNKREKELVEQVVAKLINQGLYYYIERLNADFYPWSSRTGEDNLSDEDYTELITNIDIDAECRRRPDMICFLRDPELNDYRIQLYLDFSVEERRRALAPVSEGRETITGPGSAILNHFIFPGYPYNDEHIMSYMMYILLIIKKKAQDPTNGFDFNIELYNRQSTEWALSCLLKAANNNNGVIEQQQSLPYGVSKYQDFYIDYALDNLNCIDAVVLPLSQILSGFGEQCV